MEDPIWGFSNSAGPEASSALQSCLYCGASGADFEGDDTGLFYCRNCDTVSQGVFATGTAAEDIVPSSFGDSLYSATRHRAQPRQAPSSSLKSLSKDQIDQALRSQSQSSDLDPGNNDEKRKKELDGVYQFYEGPEELRDFGGAGRSVDPEAIRVRYVQGLQLMLQIQCEALVDSFGVSPLICGVVGDVWLRYLAALRVFEEGWTETVFKESVAARSKAGEQPKNPKHMKAKNSMESHDLCGQQTAKFWANTLRKKIPLYATLAISFLVCHVSREAVLPTDIFEWALEGKLPYLAAFVDVDKHLGNPSKACCPLTSKSLFRPTGLIGAWQLEAIAGSIAQSIGLRLPSVNFYAIACRYLKDLSLPIDRILPHACRIYEWSMPAELWLSSNVHRLPTRVCVMSIIIIAIRILYNLHGQGTWERSLSTFTLPSHSQDCCSEKLSSVPSFEPKVGPLEECDTSMNSMLPKNSSHIHNPEFDAAELLGALQDVYDKSSVDHDYLKDLRSYLKYCKDVVFVGMDVSYEDGLLAERLWDMYDMQEDDKTKEEVKSGFMDSNGKRSSNEVDDTSLDSKRLKGESQEILSTQGRPKNDCYGVDNMPAVLLRGLPMSKGSSTDDRITAMQKLKLDMEEDGYQYLPPRVKMKSDGYLHYKRRRVDGKLNYAAHADYYILLRACAKLAQVDVRIMHIGVLKLERRLAWIEQRIGSSLCLLPELSPNRT